MKRWFLIGLFFVMLAAQCEAGKPESYTVVRIAVLQNMESFILSIRGAYTIVDPLTGEELEKGKKKQRSRATAQPEGISIGQNIYPFKRIKIVLRKDMAIQADEKKEDYRTYRGTMEIIKAKGNRLLLVNELDLESYIKGVLYHEVTHRWPMEAMKAQAVAARTYALYQIHQNQEQNYHVTSDIYSQVYGGRSAERYRTNIAVERTKGEILMYDGKILPAYFHSNSGGYTEDAKELWGHDLPPLKGRKDDYALSAPNANWKKNFWSKDVQSKLIASGYNAGLIKDIRVRERTASGRVKTLEIESQDGKVLTIPGKKFREILGPNIIKSNMYEVVMQGYYFDLVGKGWGHGVGLCQWGAYEMARQRFGYQEILSFYYPGAKLIKKNDL